MENKGEEMKRKIISLCSEYLSEVWSKVNFEEIKCEKLTGGSANTNYYCSIADCDTVAKNENIGPKEVIVKLYGNDIHANKDAFKFNCEAAEAVIVEKLSALGMAPKVLGLFPGGRIEEYIHSEAASVEHTRDVQFCKAIIRKIAKFHTLQLPISKLPNILNFTLIETNFSGSINELKLYTNKEKPWVSNIVNFSVENEKQWFEKYAPKISRRTVCSYNDLNLANILLKKDYTSLDDRILIIDYEMVRYYYRGYYLAYFMANKDLKMFLTEDNKYAVEQAPVDEKMRDLLLVEYLNEHEKLVNERDPNYDNIEHLSMEVDVFGLLFDVSFIAGVKAAIIAQTDSYGLPLKFVSDIVANYKLKKERVIEKYRDPEKWN